MTKIMGKLKGIRTDAWTGAKTVSEVEYEITPWEYEKAPKGSLVFQITRGGVTGFESFIIEPNDNTLQNMSKTGWFACAGTRNRYDILWFSPKEMAKVTLPSEPKSQSSKGEKQLKVK